MTNQLKGAVVIGCMDGRLDDAWVNQHYPHHDRVRLAGGARTLIKTETQAVVLQQIALSVQLHGTTVVVLMNHEDCGAYGGSAEYVDDLAKAAAIVQNSYPSLTVVTAIQSLNGDVDVIS